MAIASIKYQNITPYINIFAVLYFLYLNFVITELREKHHYDIDALKDTSNSLKQDIDTLGKNEQTIVSTIEIIKNKVIKNEGEIKRIIRKINDKEKNRI